MRAETASLVGIPSKTTWSTTATVKLDGGELYLAAGFSGSERAPHDGRRFVKLLESLPDPDSRTVYQAIEGFLRDLGAETAVSLAVVLSRGEKMALFCYGFALAGLVRGERGRWLSDGSGEKVVLEGEVKPGDLFLLATARAHELSLNLDSFVGRDADYVSALFSRVQSHPHTGEIAVLTLELKLPGGREGITAGPPQPEDEAVIPTAGPFTPPPLASRHLISPDKIERGIMASEEEKSQRIKTAVRSEWLSNLRQTFRSRRALLRIGAAAGLVLLLLLSMVLYRGAAMARERDAVVVPLEQLVNEALSLPTEKIGEQRAAVQSLLERLRATRVSYGANRRRILELLALIEKKHAEISGEKSLVNLPVFYDFRLVNSEFLSGKAAREKNRAVFLDRGKGMVISLNLDSKQNETLPSEGISDPQDIVVIESAAYILQAGQVMRSAAPAPKAEVAALLPDVAEPFLLDRFGDALYVFDRSGQQIWRLGLEKGATPSGWIRSARGVDFSTVTSLAINGSVWLGASDGAIYKFIRGERQPFSVSGLVDPFTSSLYLAVNAEGERLAVVEPAKKRLVILNKDGVYQLQVESEQIGAVTDVFFSEDERSVYLTAGSVVYRVEI